MKILLIEDDQQTSECISAQLSAHRYAVDAIANGSMGLDMALQWNYDLILLDLLLPDISGFEVCRRLRGQKCQTPILMLTARATTEDIVAGLDAGADDYLAKSCDSAQLLARVRALLRRSSTSPSMSPVLSWGALCLDPASARVTYHQTAIALRPKEYALLELFLRNPQRIFSRSTIIDHLWSVEDTPVEGVITNLIKDLRHRLRSAGMETDLIETVYGLGYRLKELPDLENENPNWVAPDAAGVQEEEGVAPRSVADLRNDWAPAEMAGLLRIQHITERFERSLSQRLAVLAAVQRSLKTGQLSLLERQAAQAEAHKLAGGLGTFGLGKASVTAQEIEDLLAESVRQETLLINQLPQLLTQLTEELAATPTHPEMAKPNYRARPPA